MPANAFDQSWSTASPGAAKAAGMRVASMYVSWDPTKNITPKKVTGYHRVGIGCLVNWEAQSGAPLNGASQGVTDATEAVRQAKALIKAVGYQPANRIVIYFSCDQDVTAQQIAGPIAEYYRAASDVCHAAGFGVGCYGEADLVHYLAGNGITDAEWQTLAWSYGRVDPAADFYQSSINNTLGGASVDFDQIIHPTQLGAWWPPDSVYNTPAEDDVTPAQIEAIAKASAQATVAALFATKIEIPAADGVKANTATLGTLLAHGYIHARDGHAAALAASKSAHVDAQAVSKEIVADISARIAKGNA